MKDKVKITFVVPQNLQGELKEKMASDGYVGKSKSKWISEAIQKLLKLQCYPELVKLNDVMHGFEKLESIVIPSSLKTQLEDAVIGVRRVYPELEGVQSRIVRTAILQRLLALG